MPQTELIIAAGGGTAVRAKLAVENGDPLSETNTNGDGSPSRCNLRKVLSSSPVSWCVLGEPFLTRRTSGLRRR